MQMHETKECVSHALTHTIVVSSNTVRFCSIFVSEWKMLQPFPSTHGTHGIYNCLPRKLKACVNVIANTTNNNDTSSVV